MEHNLNLKKEGLQLLLESYLTRTGPQDLFFLQKHVLSTDTLAQSINSDIEQGLKLTQIAQNQTLYGRNHRQTPNDLKWQKLKELLSNELLTLRTFLLIITIIFELTCGIIWENSEIISSSMTIFAIIILSFIIAVAVRWRAVLLLGSGALGKQGQRALVWRGGVKCEIVEESIRVGDLLSIDFNQSFPASGILVSEHQITVDEQSYGRGVQRKLNLQQCLHQIEHKSLLQLKIDYESKTLASPILLRGCKMVNGSGLKLLVLSVQQLSLLQKHRPENCQQKRSRSILQEWMMQTVEQLKLVANVAMLVIVFFHIIAFIFKVKGLPAHSYPDLMQIILQFAHTIIVMNLLLDANILFDLLKGQYLNALNLVGVGEQLDRFLSVQQIFITQQNVCKYDKIIPKKIVLADIHEPIDIKLLSAMQPTHTYNVVYQIMGGVGLEETLPQPVSHKSHTNVIVHLNNSQEKVFSSFYDSQPKIQSRSSNLPIDDGDSIGQMLKSQIRGLHEQPQKMNRVTPDPSAGSHQQVKLQQSIRFYIPEKDPLQYEGAKSQLSAKLDDYLSKHCHFSTQNIIEGLNKLAKNTSRTYYYQKYSLERLSKVKYIWMKQKFSPVQVEDQERLLLGIKRLQRENLTVYLIGLDQGAFSNKYMGFLVAAIGVETTYEKQIIQKLQQLQKIGIHSLFTIFTKETQEITEEQLLQLQGDFLKRKWKHQRQHFCKMTEVKQMGGRKLCSLCLTTNCNQQNRVWQLANIQGFLQVMQDVRCVYNISQQDLMYMKLGFQQLNMTTLNIVQHGEDTHKKLNQIIAGHQLIAALQQDVALWLMIGLISTFCLFPFAYVTFGHVFTYQQMYFTYFYLQILFTLHHFTGQPELTMRPTESSQTRRSKQMIGWSIKSDIIVFVLLVIIGCIMIVFLPSMMIQSTDSSNMECTYPNSFYHNPDMRKRICSIEGQSVVYYSKLQTYLYVFTMLAITVRAFLAIDSPIKPFNIILHSFVVGAFMMVVYLCPSLLHLSRDTLGYGQLGMCWMMAVSVVLLCKFSRVVMSWLSNQKSFHFELNISLGDHFHNYAQILKQYKDGKTLQYALDE